MSTRKGVAYIVTPRNEMSSNRPVIEVILRSTDPATQRIIQSDILQAQLVRKPLDSDPTRWEIAVYIPVDGPQPAMGDAVEWDGEHVWWTRDGAQVRVRKVGYEFDPDAPLH